MVHLPAFVSNTRSVVPEYTTRFESSTIPYSSTTPSPLSVFAARHTPWYWGGVPGAFDVTSTVHSPTRKSNCLRHGCERQSIFAHLPPMRSSLRFVLAWAPLWGLWFLIGMSSPGQSLQAAARDSTVAIGAAAVLGIAVWRFTRVYVWPEQLHFKFYGMHLVAGSLFAVLWMLPMIGAEALRRHVGVVEIVQLPRVVAWFA